MADEAGRSKEVDAYIAGQPPGARRALEELRSCIWQAEPGVSERMNYGIPAFALVPGGKRDKQIMIAGYPKHVGFYPHPDTIEAFTDRLGAFKFAIGSVQFPLSERIPEDLVIAMVRFRAFRVRG